MRAREIPKNLFATRGEPELDLATVRAAARTGDQPARLKAIGEFDGAVMADVQALGEFADGGGFGVRHSFNGEQRLVLLGLDAHGAGSIVAETKETANLVTEFGEGREVNIACVVAHAYIVSRHKERSRRELWRKGTSVTREKLVKEPAKQLYDNQPNNPRKQEYD